MLVTLSRKKWIKSFIACSVALSGNFAYAQRAPIVSAEGSGHSGGGRVTESDFRAYMSKIDQYLQTPEGALVFPEVAAYDKAHPQETFHNIIMNTKPSVKSGKLFDANGEERDCMSYATPGFRYFVCNSDALPVKALDSQPSFYRIVLHELLVQAGIEVPISKAVPSDYKISYRITENVHLETYQEWVPGKAVSEDARKILPQLNYMEKGTVFCTSHQNNYYFNDNHNSSLMAILKNGKLSLYNLGIPRDWSDRHQQPGMLQSAPGLSNQQITKINNKRENWDRFEKKYINPIQEKLGSVAHASVIYSGKIELKPSSDYSLMTGKSLFFKMDRNSIVPYEAYETYYSFNFPFETWANELVNDYNYAANTFSVSYGIPDQTKTVDLFCSPHLVFSYPQEILQVLENADRDFLKTEMGNSKFEHNGPWK